MSVRFPGGRRLAAALPIAAASILASTASAQVDLRIEDVVFTQAIRNLSTPLVAGNATAVRVFVDTPGFSGAVEDVDAIIRVFVDGEEADFSPLRSLNGPITSPSNPGDFDLEDHLNFVFIAPESTDVDLRIILNPYGAVPETNLTNNINTINNLFFRCRAVVDLTYVPINYTPNGAGLPSEALTQPGIGDGFVRGIFKSRNWDYHRSPTGNLTWNQDINGSSGSLLNTLRDIRVSQIPSTGFPVPPFVYGWLPGNPFSGNGQAIGIPGDVAFGNTQTSRFQRTFAHEMGHLFGLSHTSNDIDFYGIDAERHLEDPLDLGPLFPGSRLDVMVAGQQTSAAWVNVGTFNTAANDSRLACPGFDDAGTRPVQIGTQGDRGAMLRVSGIIDHRTGTVRLDPAMLLPAGLADADHPAGTLDLVVRDAAGRALHRVRAAAANTRASCADPTHDHANDLPESPLHAVVPASVKGVPAESIDVVDRASGRTLATIVRSAATPVAGFTGPAGLVGIDAGGDRLVIDEPTTVTWAASDADGDDLVHQLLYSPDGEAWLPIATSTADTAWEIDPGQLPRSLNGRLRLVTSDGFNASVIESGELALLGSGEPEIYIISPNSFDAFSQEAGVIFHGYAWDPEEGTLDDIDWFSNRDGFIGSGRLFMLDDLSPGLHQITASVTDLDGNNVSVLSGLVIQDRVSVSPDLDGDGDVDFEDLVLMLSLYGPCGDFCQGDLDGNGEVGFQDIVELLAAWTI